MNKIKKNEIYDEMCHIITDYELFGEEGHETAVDAYELYNMLVKIQNNWEELTSGED